MKNFNFNLVCCFVLVTSMHLCMSGSCFANHLTALTADAEVVLEDSIHVRIPTLCADQTQDNFCVPIIVDNVVNVVSFQLELQFDTQILEHTEIRNNHNLIIDSNTLTNSVLFLWVSDLVNEPLELTLKDNSFLVEVCFDVVDNSVGVTELILDADFAEFGRVITGPIEEVPFSLSNGSYSINNGQPSMACFANVDLSLDGTGQAFLDTNFLLAGSDCDFPYTIVEPEMVTCDDIGEVIYTVTDTLTSNSCWGTIQLSDPLNICSGYDCLDIQITLTDTFPATLTIEELVVPLPADISELTLNLESVDCGNRGFNPYAVKDAEGVLLCVGTVEVLDPMELCPSTGGVDPLPCIENLDVAIGLTGEVVLTTELVLDGTEPMPNEILITPDRVTCNDLGNDIAYSVFDWLSGRACTGTIRLLDPNNNCGSGTVLDCINSGSVVLFDDSLPFELILEDYLLIVAPNVSELTLSPNSVDCSNIGENVYTISDADGDVLCSGIIRVLDLNNVCPNTNEQCLKAIVTLRDTIPVALEIEELIVPVPSDLTGFTITPTHVDCNSIGFSQYEIIDNNGNSCSNLLQVLDPLVVCDGIVPSRLICNDHVNIVLDAFSGEVLLTPDILLEGNFPDPNNLIVEPSLLTCDDVLSDVRYTVTDSVTGNSCWGTITIEDGTPPVAVARQENIATLTLNTNGDYQVRVFAESIDNGSSDNCGDITFEPEFFDFDCSDVGLNEVILTVIDNSGNSNSLKTDILILLGSDVIQSCPDDIIINCEDDSSPAITGMPVLVDGCNSITLEFSAGAYDQNGDGDFDDEFVGPDGNIYTEGSPSTIACNNYSQVREWNAGDQSCRQIIYSTTNYIPLVADDIIWPEDFDSECIPTQVEEPVFTNTTCGLFGFTVGTETFTSTTTCESVLYNYTAIDWCIYDPSNPSSGGTFSHTTVGSIEGDGPPELSVPGDFTVNCVDEISATAVASSECTENRNISWYVVLDLNNDGTVEFEWSSDLPEDGIADLWDDDDGNGIPDVRVGNSAGEVDNLSSPFSMSGEEYIINLPEAVFVGGQVQHRMEYRATNVCGSTTVNSWTLTVDAVADTQKPSIECVESDTLSLDANNNLVLVASELILDASDNCTSRSNLRYTFSNLPPDQDACFNAGINSSVKTETSMEGHRDVIVYVWDNAGNVSACETFVVVIANECFFSDEAIDWPDDSISLLAEDNSASADWLNPDELISVYGFREDQVRPSVDCNSVLIDYADSRLIAAENGTKIIREWTVLDWLSSQFFERTQIITVYVPSLGICDFQPNNFPEGDCQSGHTLDDDVEWPADLIINDYRIDPDELIAFSGVEEKNAEPQFFGATEYIYSYTDILLELGPENLDINREWTVFNPLEPAHVWVYSQSLSVNLGITERAVIVQTISGRPIPGVDMTDGRFTNIIGTAIIEQDDQIHPRYKDHILNGVNIKDAFIMDRRNQGLDELTPNQLLAGDLNLSDDVNTIDLILLQRAIVGSDTLSYEGHWEFIEESNGSVASDPQQFLGIKPGDIDDSALLLNEEVNLPEEIITFDDRLLNAGEVYELPLSIIETESGYGVQLSVKFDPNMIEIESVENAANVFSRVLEETTDNTIDFLAHDVFESKDLTDSPIMTIRFRAIANGVLSQAIAMNDERPSYILNDQQNLVLLSEMVDGAITVSVDDVADQDIVIYPNPASNRLTIDSEYPVLGYSLYNILGNKVKQGNETIIELSDITEGSYFIMVETSAGKHAEKVLIVK